MSAFSWDSVQLWRCKGCGKWSHAKKQPKKHFRTVYEGDELYNEDLGERAKWATSDFEGDLGPDCHVVDCGPFTGFVASPGRLR